MIRFIALAAFLLSSAAHADAGQLEDRWAHIQYEVENEDDQETQMNALLKESDALVAKTPADDHAKLWNGIIASTAAGLEGAGSSALKKAEQARDTFLALQKSTDTKVRGTSLMMLGVLYDRVPGWPVAFGDSDKAKEYFQKANAENTGSIDQNYFYGKYLADHKQTDAARKKLTDGLALPKPSPQTLADSGRREDIQKLLQELDAKRASR